MTLITDNEPWPPSAAGCTPSIRHDRHRVHARPHLLPQALPGPGRGENEAVAIDPLAPGLDLAPLLGLLADEAVLKVMHAARQDLEIFSISAACPGRSSIPR